MRVVRPAMLVIGCVGIGLWLVGIMLSDRFTATQFCSWIPAIAMTPLCLLAAAAARSPRLRTCWCLIAAVTAGWWFLVDQPWRPGTASADGLTLMQWTMSHDKSDRVTHANHIVETDADITILTHGYGVRGTNEIMNWLGPDARPYKLGFFTVLTRLPVRQLRPLAAGLDIHARIIEIDTTQQLGRPIRIAAVDLPSKPDRSRWEIARTLRTWLDERDAGPIDIALGDFNMRRGSAALASIFPDLTHAWDLAGHGWGPTWIRGLPLYRIDHILVADWLDVLDCTTQDPGIGRHLTQHVVLDGRHEADEAGE